MSEAHVLTADEALAARLIGSSPETPGPVPEQAKKMVIFALGEECFAFAGERIREILLEADLFFVPGCPPSLEGVINVRGDITSVIRLHELLELPATTTDPQRASTILLGCNDQGMMSGIRVGRVIDVVDIAPGLIQPPPATLPERLRARMPGLFHFAGQAVTLLDIDQLFADYARGLG